MTGGVWTASVCFRLPFPWQGRLVLPHARSVRPVCCLTVCLWVNSLPKSNTCSSRLRSSKVMIICQCCDSENNYELRCEVSPRNENAHYSEWRKRTTKGDGIRNETLDRGSMWHVLKGFLWHQEFTRQLRWRVADSHRTTCSTSCHLASVTEGSTLCYDTGQIYTYCPRKSLIPL